MAIQGGCYCGATRYEAAGEPVMKAQCHCRECQYISGGGPNYFMMMPEDGFAWTQGTPATFTRSDIESPRTREYCPTCGTHMTTRLPGRPLVVVKVGTLDDPAGAYGGPTLAIFTCDAQPFHEIPEGMPSFEKLPTR
ncbi:MAG: GFA family protein [Pseudomonadota bacterium]|nr:GFA family protein [Pseudomonadota bacterium]